MMQKESSKKLTVHDRGTDSEIAFVVQDGDTVFDDYGISHTKEMHLIVVRDDLQYFQHLHPKRDANGIWHTTFTTPAGGMYWHYADFVDSEGNPHTIRFEKKYSGNPGTQGIVKNFEKTKTVKSLTFVFKPETSGNEVTFAYAVTDSKGKRGQLEEYLGAMGHSVLISPKGDFIHTHPSEENALPVFATKKPSDDFYRIFTQFQIDGKVVTVAFDWEQ